MANGGGLLNQGKLTLTNGNIHDNSAPMGGGIANDRHPDAEQQLRAHQQRRFIGRRHFQQGHPDDW